MDKPLPQLHYQRLTEGAPSCENCELHLEAPTHVGVPGVLDLRSLPPSPTTPLLVIIGQNPGRQEDAQNYPFIGETGEDLHTKYLTGIHAHTLATIYLLNAYRCFHRTGTPRPTYVTRCHSHLQDDLDLICGTAPRTADNFILALGASATHAVSIFDKGPRSLTDAFRAQGRPVQISGLSWSVFATYHPAAVMRTRNLAYPVHDHLQLLLDALQGCTPIPSKPNIVPPFLPHERRPSQ